MVGVMMVDQQDQLPVVAVVVLVVLDLIILVVLLVMVVEGYNILSLELPSIMLLVEAEEQELAVLLEQEVIV